MKLATHLAVIASDGVWRSNDMRGYIDMATNVERDVRLLFHVGLDSESEKEVPPSHCDRAKNPPLPDRRGRFSQWYRGFASPIAPSFRLHSYVLVKSQSGLFG